MHCRVYVWVHNVCAPIYYCTFYRRRRRRHNHRRRRRAAAAQGSTVNDLAESIRYCAPLVLQLISEAVRLSLPVSVANSERSFSCLRRLKTWLRSCMLQKRLTHTALFHIHKYLMDKISLKQVMSEFISKTPERCVVFGRLD